MFFQKTVEYCCKIKEIYKNYVQSLISELKLRINNYKSEIETIYIGGGTPSVLGVKLLKYLLDNINKL